MPAQPGFEKHLRMVEFGVKPPPEPLHDVTGFLICDSGEGPEFFQMKLLKAERDGRLRGLHGITQAPMWFCRAPADFHAGGER